MHHNPKISSLHNSKVKELVKLSRKANYRTRTNQFLVEGLKEIESAIQAGFDPSAIFHETSCARPSNIDAKILHEVTPQVMDRISYRATTEGIIGIFDIKNQDLEQSPIWQSKFIVILDQVEKPGNIGAILRTCDGLAIEGLILSSPKTDLHNPNTIRSSVGTFFHVPIVSGARKDIVKLIREHHFNLYVSHLDASQVFDEISYEFPAVLVLGSEANGVHDEWHQIADTLIKIPMKGYNDSLNVSVAAALMMYQIQKQSQT